MPAKTVGKLNNFAYLLPPIGIFMIEPPAYFFERSTLRTFVEQADAALSAKRGFSLVRLGDGEGPMLIWPERRLPGELDTVLRTWFGRDDFSSSDLQYIADGLRGSVRSADVVGLPTRYQLSRTPRYGMVFDGINAYGLHSSSRIYVDAIIHWYLQWSAALRYLLRNVEQVRVVGSRDIGPKIAETFKLKSVQTYLVRGEHAYPGTVSQPHWPDGFHEVMARLDDVEPGDVFLVGAGVLGKIYCDRIKAKGGIAIDIGSLLDSWAGVDSRVSFKTSSPAFTLDYYRTVGNDWTNMTASLHDRTRELHARDTTITY